MDTDEARAGLTLADPRPAEQARERAAGLARSLSQGVKHFVARWLGIGEQAEFNRASIDCVDALIEAVNRTNRALTALRYEMEQTRLAAASSEVQLLRSVADLQAAFQHRAMLMESNFRDLTATQHKDFTVTLDQGRIDAQDRLRADFERVRGEFERLIDSELRVMRQRGIAAVAAPVPLAAPPGEEAPGIDLLRFAERFRGSEERVREARRRYVKHFEGSVEVLDLGCGRGEFLECLRDSGILARGVEANEELVAYCESKGLYAERADLFEFLTELKEGTVDGIFCGQVVEHLPPARLPQLIRLCGQALRRGGLLVIEASNPECPAFTAHFYLDPSRRRPVPAPLLAFYLEEAGFGRIAVEAGNGSLDYAISARRMG